MTIPDPISEIIGLLKGDTAVDALVDGRVGREITESENAAMPRAAVVVTPVGGPGRHGRLRIRYTRVDTTCFGATLKESWTLHLAVREVLESMGRDGALKDAEITSDGTNARDPVTQWPTCYASYRVMSATES